MKSSYKDLFQPNIINSVSGLSLIARVIVDEFLSGKHQSRRVGQGLEFSQYRGYQAGDDMRLLDWKMLARSGRYYIKQADIETQVAVKFIIDASASMNYTEEGLSKMDYARVLAASLAYLAHQQGDAVGLFSLNNEKINRLYPTTHKQHYNRILAELIQIKCAGIWPKTSDDIHKVHNRNHKELLFFITDMHEDDQELSDWIGHLKTSKNEVAVLQIVGENETKFDYSGDVVFEDLETNKRIQVNSKDVKQYYLNAFEEHLKKVKNSFLMKDIGYELFHFNAPIEEGLQLFLKRRKSLS